MQTKTTSNSERGASPVSVILVLAMVLMITELIIMGGRVVATHAQVANAAREAARTGSLAASASSYETLTRDAADATLANQNTPCVNQPEVDTTGTDFRRGGSVTATVQCTVDLSDLGLLLNIPFLPDFEVTAEHTELIETYRVVG